MPEIWKPIPGYEKEYYVSSLGRVKSIPRRILMRSIKGKEFYIWRRGKILKPGDDGKGYLNVNIRDGNSQKVHRLVLLAFIGPKPTNADVLHLDGNKKNNKLINLRYGTRSENSAMVFIHGGRKLKPAQVLAIRKSKKIYRDLAKEFNVSVCAIGKIKRHEQWPCS